MIEKQQEKTVLAATAPVTSRTPLGSRVVDDWPLQVGDIGISFCDGIFTHAQHRENPSSLLSLGALDEGHVSRKIGQGENIASADFVLRPQGGFHGVGWIA